MLLTLCRQLELTNPGHIKHYIGSRGYERHSVEIQVRYGYRVFADIKVGLRFTRWLYAICWTGTDRPGELFNRATTLMESYS